jgi:trigger factor
MQSTIERISPVECRVRVEIPWPDVSTRLDDKMRDLRKKARLPGFRPGKIPPQVLERMFGKSVRDEVARDLVQETFQSAVSEHKATALTQPVLEESQLDKGKPFVYAARFEVPPDIEPKDYTGVPVRRRPAVIDETKIDAEIEKKRAELTELRPLPEGETRELTQPGDVWTADVEGTLGTTRVSRKDASIEIGADKSELVPGLAKALEGTKLTEVGTSKTLRFVPAEDRVRPEYRGQEAVLLLALRDVRVKHVPELDDEFARDTGDAETMAELRSKIGDTVREADAQEAEQQARRRMVETLLERNEFDPAPSLIAREVAAQVDNTKRQLAQQGMRLANLGTNEQQLAQRIRPQALFNVKAYLLLDAIGKKEGIDVSDAELDKELEEMAADSGQNLARMRAGMEKNNQLLLLRAQMREEKILDFLMGKAEVTEAPDPEGESAGDEASSD